MPSASPWYASIAGRRVSTARHAAAVPWSETALMRAKFTGSGIGARDARDASTTSPARCWQGHHQPLRVWVLCLYLMGLNLSNRQIAQELGLDGSDVQAMTEQLRRGLVAKIAPVRLEGEV